MNMHTIQCLQSCQIALQLRWRARHLGGIGGSPALQPQLTLGTPWQQERCPGTAHGALKRCLPSWAHPRVQRRSCRPGACLDKT